MTQNGFACQPRLVGLPAAGDRPTHHGDGQTCDTRLSSPLARRATPATIGWTGLASPEGR
jgi:hypothetical protein